MYCLNKETYNCKQNKQQTQIEFRPKSWELPLFYNNMPSYDQICRTFINAFKFEIKCGVSLNFVPKKWRWIFSLVAKEWSLNFLLGTFKEWSLNFSLVQGASEVWIFSLVLEWSLNFLLGTYKEWSLNFLLRIYKEWRLNFLLGTYKEWSLNFLLGTYKEWSLNFLLGTFKEWSLNFLIGTYKEWSLNFLLGTFKEWRLNLLLGTGVKFEFSPWYL